MTAFDLADGSTLVDRETSISTASRLPPIRLSCFALPSSFPGRLSRSLPVDLLRPARTSSRATKSP